MKNFLKKWYTYQKERFPVLVYALYVFCIVFAAFCFYNYYAEMLIYSYDDIAYIDFGIVAPYKIEWIKLVPMFIVTFLQFLMVRIIDEFKDYEEDCKYRAYRPVPRGLITLKELKVLFIICVILQLIITVFCSNGGLLFLIILWIFFAIMSKGFFIKKFLDKHLLLEVTLDELLMPIIMIFLMTFVPQTFLNYNSSADFSITNIPVFSEVWKLALLSYVISWIVEVARKVRCKEDEEEGVRTYTAVFGINGAVFILFVLETILLDLNILILDKPLLAIIATAIYIVINIINLLFVVKKSKIFAKLVELSANLAIMLAYLSLVVLII